MFERESVKSEYFQVRGAGFRESFGANPELVMIVLMLPTTISLYATLKARCEEIVKTLGGEVIRITAGSEDHVNATDMIEGFGEVHRKSSALGVLCGRGESRSAGVGHFLRVE